MTFIIIGMLIFVLAAILLLVLYASDKRLFSNNEHLLNKLHMSGEDIDD